MFKGNYNFFDYKYNIEGYTGQDYGSVAQYIYLIISAILISTLLIILRKSSKGRVLKIIQVSGIFLTVLYIVKTVWESVYDINLMGECNTGLLPFDTCSIIMITTIISGFTKGKLKKFSDAWLATGGVLGGFATMLFLNAFKYYPFVSFGAFYSMLWHFMMVFIGLLVVVTNYIDIKYMTVINGYIFQLFASIIVIPLDYICNWDFMLYLNLGGVPFFEDVAIKLTAKNLQFINTIIMLTLYFIAFNIVFMIPYLIKKILNKYTIKKEKQNENRIVA